MKKIYTFIFSLILISILSSCDKNDGIIKDESLSTSVENITPYSAKITVNHTFESPNLLKKGIALSILSSSEKQPSSENFIVADNSDTNFIIDLDNLSAGNTYFIIPFAIYPSDTIFGNEIKFTTEDYLLFNPSVQYGLVTDIDQNKYKTVQIGDQVWMAENLRVTRFRNGEPIMISEKQKNLLSPALYWYNNSENNKEVYGAYYNWFAVTDERNIAPEGWRVATKSDWEKLFRFTGNKADPLQEVSTAHWKFGDERFFNVNSNSTGFTAVSSGVAMQPIYQGKNGNWTSFWASDKTAPYKISLFLYPNETTIQEAWDNFTNGYSIRCIKE
ncbi:MAG: fibrobacter succinogenes major paralogous domain-containing protein [Petrimonas sp.]|nr:fibrobacter succinogenes major paralogous domain-containing protein [Petrimonas sp.]